MSIPGSASPLFLTSAAAEVAGYQIERSLRFNSADSAYLSRTPASAGNRKTWTWSGWVKRSKLGVNHVVANANNGNSDTAYGSIQFLGSDVFRFGAYNNTWRDTAAVFRDTSAWYHFVVALDTTQPVGNDRVKIYVNGTAITNFGILNNPSQNAELAFNQAAGHNICRSFLSADYFNGLLANIHFIDGQALDPTSFGEFDDNGIWQPKEYSGTYGTNGFHLDFSDNSSASALGTDAAGSNDWTVNNIFAETSGLTGYYYAAGYVKTGANDAGNFNTNSSTFAFFASNDSWGIYKINGSTSVDVVFKGYATNRGFGYAFSNDPSIRNPSSVTWVSYDHGSAPGGTAVTATLSNSNGYKYLYVCGWLDGIFLPPGFDTGGDSVYFASCNDFGTTPTGQDSILDLEAGIDSLIDTPTNYEASSGNNGGNYATLNPLNSYSSTLSNGNLDWSSSTVYGQTQSTIAVSSGKWYYEAGITAANNLVGIKDVSVAVPGSAWSGNRAYYSADGTKFLDGTATSYGASFAAGDVIGVALDMDAGTLVFYKNGVSQGTAFTGITGTQALGFLGSNGSAASASINFGQRPFAYTPPTGYKSLCTTNLPDPTIADGSTAMDATLYAGNSSTQAISGLNFSPDLVWEKARSTAYGHTLFDSVRGVSLYLASEAATGESDLSPNGLISFNSDGWTASAVGGYNESGTTYVGWAWDAGSSTVSNSDGSITSNVRASQTNGFSIITYTGNGTAGATIGHGLNAAPSFYICKFRNTNSSNGPWYVYHGSLGATKALILDTTSAAITSNNFWNSTEPTNTVFSVGVAGDTNGSGRNFVAYCWAPVEGYSAFGSYTGNGSADGPFVFTGFRPRWVMVKRTDSDVSSHWWIWDTARLTYNPINNPLFPNLASAEITSYPFDALSNGFKIRDTNAANNGSGGTFIYAAFAEHPFASNARAR